MPRVTAREYAPRVRTIGIYLALTIAFSAAFEAIAIGTHDLSGGRGTFVAALMWSPAAAAFLTCRITGKPYSELGFRWHTRGALIAWAIPLAYSLVAYVPVWLSGLGHFYDAATLVGIAKAFHTQSYSPPLQLASFFVLTGTLGVIRGCATALGEEIGWRGFLVPELAKRMSFIGVSVVSGLIWGLWHAPVIVFGNYNAGTPIWWSLPSFVVGIVCGSFVLTWLRLRTGSVWPAAILHASHNVFVQQVFNPLTADTGRTAWIVGEFGIALTTVSVVMAFVVWKLQKSESADGRFLLGHSGI